jgi:hypothetical protein
MPLRGDCSSSLAIARPPAVCHGGALCRAARSRRVKRRMPHGRRTLAHRYQALSRDLLEVIMLTRRIVISARKARCRSGDRPMAARREPQPLSRMGDLARRAGSQPLSRGCSSPTSLHKLGAGAAAAEGVDAGEPRRGRWCPGGQGRCSGGWRRTRPRAPPAAGEERCPADRTRPPPTAGARDVTASSQQPGDGSLEPTGLSRQ